MNHGGISKAVRPSLAICRRNLGRLDAAIESWTSAGTPNGTIEKDIEKVIARRDKLRRLLDADRFVELQKQVAAEIAFLYVRFQRARRRFNDATSAE